MDVLEHLMQEHRTAEDLLAQLARSDAGPQREQLLGELTDALTTHMAVEERFVYPLLAETVGNEESDEAETEHDLTREGLAQMQALVGVHGFGAAVAMVTAGIAHHVREEEQELFPQLRQQAGEQLAQLDPEELEAAVKRDGPNRTNRSRTRNGTQHGNGRNGTQGDGDDATKEELYARAQEADIPGRSRMTKEELAAALARQ